MDHVPVLSRTHSRPLTAPMRGRSLALSEMDAQELGSKLCAIPFARPLWREYSLGTSHRSHLVYADDCDVMVGLMEQTQPSPPPRARREDDIEDVEKNETEGELYIKSLVRAIDEGVVKKRQPHARSMTSLKEGAGVVSVGESAVNAAPVDDKSALQVWTDEELRRGHIERSAHAFCTSRSLLNAVDKGRFPLDANATLTETLKKLEKDQRENQDEAFLTSPEAVFKRENLLERLIRGPVHSWRAIHNLSTPPPPLYNRRRDSYDPSRDITIGERWRHRFDYVNYTEQFNIDESLATRDLCRNMVIRHETDTFSKPPLGALGGMFRNCSSRISHADDRAVPNHKEESVWNSVWTRRASEIALERERLRLIDAIRGFELRVAAAALSKEAVCNLRDSLVKVLRQWPCNYKKRHVFTKADFVEWVRGRYKLPPNIGAYNPESLSLTESMPSSAEAAFVEYVLTVLPDDRSVNFTRKTRMR